MPKPETKIIPNPAVEKRGIHAPAPCGKRDSNKRCHKTTTTF